MDSGPVVHPGLRALATAARHLDDALKCAEDDEASRQSSVDLATAAIVGSASKPSSSLRFQDVVTALLCATQSHASSPFSRAQIWALHKVATTLLATLNPRESDVGEMLDELVKEGLSVLPALELDFLDSVE